MFRAIIAIAVVALAGFAGLGMDGASAGGGCHREVFSDEAGVAVDLSENCFNPTVIRVDSGGTVTWTNRDEVPHSVTGAAGSFGDYEDIAGGDAVSYTFDAAGVFPYFCVIHPSMVGAVVVGDGQAAGDAADSGVAATTADTGGGDDGGISASTVTAIAAAVAVGGAAVGMVGSRVLSARREERAAA